ncbi:hypothetical protein XBFM1_2420006 [Xenorhabdus bovienii str. feltiae Moldova]|uniref:Uncharacterized protein n=3 Tax=Xenorhabdus bovienii TaxID=40576 RepID=A0A0B6X8Q3_XENBV|nr:hypothetical protein XBFM1_2420006 [Xenorhabdus bovienii str. feltiae Moldova]CDH25024.1 hypothetical protein XBKB1_3530001 [Xenorhabdus bovienii str. kraussei Becker Underwood]CDM89556.1 protein of unknown function [Xenorhabdus bovienii]
MNFSMFLIITYIVSEDMNEHWVYFLGAVACPQKTISLGAYTNKVKFSYLINYRSGINCNVDEYD